jgi:hypothetical protein
MNKTPKKTITKSAMAKLVKDATTKSKLTSGKLKSPKNLRKKMTPEQRLANLGAKRVTFEKGNTYSVGNGRPKGSTSIAMTLKRLMKYAPPPKMLKELKEKYPHLCHAEDIDIGTAIWLRALDQSIEGNDTARAFVADRTEGKVKDVLQVEETPADTLTDEQKAKLADALDQD